MVRSAFLERLTCLHSIFLSYLPQKKPPRFCASALARSRSGGITSDTRCVSSSSAARSGIERMTCARLSTVVELPLQQLRNEISVKEVPATPAKGKKNEEDDGKELSRISLRAGSYHLWLLQNAQQNVRWTGIGERAKPALLSDC